MQIYSKIIKSFYAELAS